MRDVQPPVIVSRTDLRETLPGCDALILDLDEVDPTAQMVDSVPVLLDQLCYVIHTSGSEGRPKGVYGTHRNSLNRFIWEWDHFPFGQDEVCCQKTSLGFIDSVWEIFGPLLKGVPLVIFDDDTVRDAARFAQQLESHRVTRLVAVPSLLEVLVQDGTAFKHLVQCVASGETFPAELAMRILETAPQLRLLNYYGSSEVAGDVTYHAVTRVESPVPIGKPIANTRIYLLDPFLHPVSGKTPGDLFAAGQALTRGYVNRPALTAAQFIPHPLSDIPGDRLYRTGDLGTFDDQNRILFAGRADHQVKIRGQRVEPSEVEAALKMHQHIGSAAVIPFTLQGQTHLAAYFTVAHSKNLSRKRCANT